MGIEKMLLNAGLRWLADAFIQNQRVALDGGEGSELTEELSEKDKALVRVKEKDGSVTVILGTRETGKSELSYRYAEFLDRPTFAISPEQRPPGWITRLQIDGIDDIPPKSTLIMDDLPAYFSNRDYNESLSRTLERIIPMVRHERKLHLIFNSQSAAQADRFILDCDMAFFKPLGLLYQDMERDNIRRIYRQFVDPAFESRDDYFIVRHAYMWSRTHRGLITVNKASVEGSS